MAVVVTFTFLPFILDIIASVEDIILCAHILIPLSETTPKVSRPGLGYDNVQWSYDLLLTLSPFPLYSRFSSKLLFY